MKNRVFLKFDYFWYIGRIFLSGFKIKVFCIFEYFFYRVIDIYFVKSRGVVIFCYFLEDNVMYS